MTNKIAAGVLSLGMFVALAAPLGAQANLTEAQIQSILSLLNSFGADAATVSNVETSLRGGTPSGSGSGTGSSASVCPFTWTRSLTIGDSGADVRALQQFLNADADTRIAASGVGSAGNETDFFGSLTAAAVAKFQDKYASEVLAPVGLSAGTGFFGSSSRAKANALCVAGNNNGGGDNNGGQTAPVTGAGLNVMIGANSPVNVALVQGQGIGELAQFTFTNNNNAAMDVTNLVFNRIGVSTDDAISNVYVYRGGERLTDAGAVSNSQFSFQNSEGIFSIPAGSAVTISVRADIATGTNGQQIGVELVSVGASGALNAGVSFPIRGSTHTVSSASLATLEFTVYSGPENDSNFTPTDDVEVWENTINVGTRAIDFQSITLENRGSADPSDIVNLELYIDGVKYGDTEQLNSRDRVTFDLSDNPVRLETGNRILRVLADVIGGSGETLDFEVRRSADVLAIDSELNQPVSAVLTDAGADPANTIDSASLSVVRSNTSSSESVAFDATNVKWGTFEFRATGENVKVEALTVDADTNGVGGLDNGKVFLNGSQIGSTRDIVEAGTTEFTFGSSMILTQGETAIVDIYADAKTVTGASHRVGTNVTVGVSVTASDTEGIDSGNTIGSSISEVESFQRNIAGSSVTATRFSGYGNQTLIAGANEAVLGSFTLSGASTQDVNINTITVTLSSENAATVTNLMLKDRNSGEELGTTRVTPSTSNSFSVNFELSESATKTIDVVANIKSGSHSGTWQASVSGSGSGVTTGTSVTINSVALQTITLGTGTLAASVGAGDPNSDNVIAGQSSVHVGQFNFSAANSAYHVRELQVKIPNDAATSVTEVTLRYTDSNGSVASRSQAVVTDNSSTSGVATFTNLDFYIPADDDRNIDVYVGIPTIASGAKAGAAISVDLDNNTGFKAVDAAGTTETFVNGSGDADVSGNGSFYVRKSVPTFGAASKPTSVPSAGTALYEFTVSADAAGAIEWKKLTINVATNDVTLTNFFLREKGVTTNINDDFANAASDGDVVIFAGVQGDNDVQQIAAGASRTYQLFANTITGWGNDGDSISINIVEDINPQVVGSADAVIGNNNNFVWSDRSATSHSTATADWTNSFLIDDLSGGDAVSYSR